MEKKFNQKEYISQYNKEHYKQLKVDLKKEDMEELNELLKEKKLNKRQFVLKSKDLLKRGEFMGKISNLYLYNTLEEMASSNLNKQLDNKFYDFYFLNGFNWLVENAKKIINDFFSIDHKFEYENGYFKFTEYHDKDFLLEAIKEAN